jgi:hypothetical protein
VTAAVITAAVITAAVITATVITGALTCPPAGRSRWRYRMGPARTR